MRLLSRILWILTFLVASYSWMVAFEYGFSWNRYREGYQAEWRTLYSLFLGKESASESNSTH